MYVKTVCLAKYPRDSDVPLEYRQILLLKLLQKDAIEPQLPALHERQNSKIALQQSVFYVQTSTAPNFSPPGLIKL